MWVAVKLFNLLRHYFFTDKMKAIICVALACVALAAAFPQKEGGAYTNEAISQARNTFLIPKDAEIQKVSNNYIQINLIHPNNFFSIYYIGSRRNRNRSLRKHSRQSKNQLVRDLGWPIPTRGSQQPPDSNRSSWTQLETQF